MTAKHLRYTLLSISFILKLIMSSSTSKMMKAVDMDSIDKESMNAWLSVTLPICAVLIWLRQLSLFNLHPTVGPLIKSITVMVTSDLKIFCAILLIVLFGFTSAFSMVAYEVDGYKNYVEVVVTLFDAMMGNYDIYAFKAYAGTQVYVRRYSGTAINILYCIQ